MSGALDGLLVVTLEQAVAAPLCTRKLADAGARVIKVERPEGDFARYYDTVASGQSAYFVWLNYGKESVALNLKDPEDFKVLTAMLHKADVLMENFKPGAVERLGIDYDALSKDNPGLVMCSITGYGEGPYKHRKAYDLLVQAESGLASITGAPEQPGRVGVSVVDVGTGMYAYEAILEALLVRGRTAKGARITVSLFDAMAEWMAVPFLQYEGTGKAPERVGLRHPSIAPYGVYETRDGKQILISIQNEREWVVLCRDALEAPELVEDPDFKDNSARVAYRPKLEKLVSAVFKSFSFDEMTERLNKADIAYGALNSVEGLAAHPHLRRMDVDTETGAVEVPTPPAMWGEGAAEGSNRRVPKLGEHTEKIKAEFAPE